MAYMGSSLSMTRRCAHALGTGLCIGCLIGVLVHHGVRGPQIEKVPSATVVLKDYQFPGRSSGGRLDEGHYEVSTSTSTGAIGGAAWGYALVPPSTPYTTDLSSGSNVLKGTNGALFALARSR